MKKKIQTALRPGRAAFYVLFLLFAACGLYFSKPYGFIGMAIVIILRMVAIRSDAERRQRVYDLMENIEIEGGEIRPAVTKSPLRPLSRSRRPDRSSGRTRPSRT
ncbi:hypothetical protein DW766_10315 [Butyricicoccus sp. AM29-23AC]|nr:hypothetical protein DW766_10315 [Butyricicoccus sp. AM29-23AC]